MVNNEFIVKIKGFRQYYGYCDLFCDWWISWVDLVWLAASAVRLQPTVRLQLYRMPNGNWSCGCNHNVNKIILVIDKSDKSDFVNHYYGYRPDWTPLAPISIIYFSCRYEILEKKQRSMFINSNTKIIYGARQNTIHLLKVIKSISTLGNYIWIDDRDLGE